MRLYSARVVPLAASIYQAQAKKFRSKPRMTLAVAPAIHWKSSVAKVLREGDCVAKVGDCLFACVAHWMNEALETSIFTPRAMRIIAAANVIDGDDFDIVNADIASGEGLPLAPDRHALCDRIVNSAWGCHSLIVALLKGISAILKVEVSAIIVKGANEAPLVLTVSEDSDPIWGIVLRHFESSVHYKIVGDEAHSVVYFSQTKEFFPSTKRFPAGWS